MVSEKRPAVLRVWRWRAVPALVLVTGLLLLPVCDLLHLCGCRAPWSGAAAHCNVHEALGPRCPWCEHPALGTVAMVGIFAGQGGILLGLRRRGAAGWAAGGASVAALVPLALLVGALCWLPTDYPHFLLRDARERLGLPDGPISCVARAPRPAVAVCCRD
jgi:hypothetical protein